MQIDDAGALAKPTSGGIEILPQPRALLDFKEHLEPDDYTVGCLQAEADDGPSPSEISRLVEMFTAGQYVAAVAPARQLTQRWPLHGFAWKLLGSSLVQIGRSADALIPIRNSVLLMPNDAEVYNNLGVVEWDIGLLDEAIASYKKALLIHPSFAEVHSNLGEVRRLLGKFDEAVSSCQLALASSPGFAMAHNNLGNAQRNLGRLTSAVESYRKALAIDPNCADTYNNLGNVQRDLGRVNDAVASFAKALEINPDCAEAHSNLGAAQHILGELDNAATSCRRALEINPGLAEGHNNLGNIQRGLGQNDAAVASFLRALKSNPQYAGAHNNLAVIHRDLGRVEEAVAGCKRALLINPVYFEAHSNLGTALRDLGMLDNAATSCRRALDIDPRFAEAHNTLGSVLADLGRLCDAVGSFRRASLLDPGLAEPYKNLAVTQRDLAHLAEAVASCQRALAIDPSYAEARTYLGLILLLMGNLEEGLEHYESRLDSQWQKRSSRPPEVMFPMWQGESLVAKSLLVWHEQGLGDQIQFCRYLPILRQKGARRITLVCAAPLTALFQRFDGADEILTTTEAAAIPTHDYWTFLLSIPLHCNAKLGSIPAVVPYLFADAGLQQRIAARCTPIEEFRLGVCWQGGSAYSHDGERSPGLAPFGRLCNLANVRFFALQPDSRDDFLSLAGSAAFDLGHEIDSLTQPFEETAALIMNLDLVITCDTSIGHLAGALGKPVWVVLPLVPDWRWMMDREDSPWYPNTRLFRQTVRGDWADVFERVARRLESVVAGESPIVWPIAATQ